MNLTLQEILIIGSCTEQVKFSELTMDMFRMLQTLEREPQDDYNHLYDTSPAPVHGSGTGRGSGGYAGVPGSKGKLVETGNERFAIFYMTLLFSAALVDLNPCRIHKWYSRRFFLLFLLCLLAWLTGYPIENGDRSGKRDNPHKYLLYKPSLSQVLVFLASGFKELPLNGALLLYISADGCFSTTKHPEDSNIIFVDFYVQIGMWTLIYIDVYYNFIHISVEQDFTFRNYILNLINAMM